MASGDKNFYIAMLLFTVTTLINLIGILSRYWAWGIGDTHVGLMGYCIFGACFWWLNLEPQFRPSAALDAGPPPPKFGPPGIIARKRFIYRNPFGENSAYGNVGPYGPGFSGPAFGPRNAGFPPLVTLIQQKIHMNAVWFVSEQFLMMFSLSLNVLACVLLVLHLCSYSNTIGKYLGFATIGAILLGAFFQTIGLIVFMAKVRIDENAFMHIDPAFLIHTGYGWSLYVTIASTIGLYMSAFFIVKSQGSEMLSNSNTGIAQAGRKVYKY